MFNFFKKTTPKGKKITLSIKGMHCPSCALNIDEVLEEKPGVFSVEAKYAQSQAIIDFDPEQLEIKDLQAALKELGYDSELKKN